MAAIVISHLKKQFSSTVPLLSQKTSTFCGRKNFIIACDDISLTVKKGELLSIIGPNGSGKTTILKILSTIILPDEGSITVDGYDIRKNSVRVRESISFVTSEHNNFYVRLTGRQNLEFFASLYRLAGEAMRRKIDELADFLEIKDSLDIMFQEYSSGIKQRFLLARGLLRDALVFLFDEPLKNLDPGISLRLRTYIKEKLVKKNGKTVLLTGHMLSEISEISDRIAILKKGSIKACGNFIQLRDGAGIKDNDLNRIYQFYVNN